MRIAILLTSMGIGGAERQAIQVAERLQGRGHTVALFSLLGAQPEEWVPNLPVTYLSLGKGIHSIPGTWLRAADALRAFRPEVLHAHCFHGNLFARLLQPRLPGVCVISTVHNIYEGGRGRMLLYRATDHLSRCTVFVCRAGAERYGRMGAVSASRSRVLPNGIDTAEFARDPERRYRTRAALSRSDAFVWLAAGRLAAAKDYPTLLRAFALVHAAAPSAQLWVAGQGDPQACAAMELLTSQLRLGGAVRWLGLRRDLPALLDAADGFVLSSAWEGMPLALGEAMAMEKPIVATAVGGVPELAGPRICLVPRSEPAAMAEAMMETMQIPLGLRADEGRAARARIEEHFSIGAAVDRWEALYYELCGIDLPRRLPARPPASESRMPDFGNKPQSLQSSGRVQ